MPTFIYKASHNVAVVIVVVLGSFFTSCDWMEKRVESGLGKAINLIELPPRPLSREVSANDIQGRWSITVASAKRLDCLTDANEASCPVVEMSFYTDGTATYLISVNHLKPEFQERFYRASDFRDTLRVTGSWSMLDDTGSGNSFRQPRIETRYDFENVASYYTLELSHIEDLLILWTYIGDPDQTQYQEYEVTN